MGNSVDPDQMPHSVASDLGLHCLQGPIMSQYLRVFVLRFYGSVNPMGSCRARSVYLTIRLLGGLSPLSD